ncbi:UDP-glucose 4-epimerase GalE [Halalkalibacter kiskunsagensis]|uniref:UDP-glucose 4-epimerase n=1 Tax=Halalkalibacter kiskunsagensis TaxID=1548599 RepID=A0ABV6KBN3_9BACI
MSILVTGGVGYIGSHTCVELLNCGYEVIIVDSLLNSKLEVVKRVKEITGKDFRFYQIDLLNKIELEQVFSENNIEAVVHFAGLKAVGESVLNPIHYYDSNINTTINLCELMQKYKVNKMVFSSSATVYGTPHKVPIKEDFPLIPTNPYGQTKLVIENLLYDLYVSDNKWGISILRYFNPIGAHRSGKIGEDPKGTPNNLMPFLTQVAIGKLPKLQVFGNNYPTIDGTGVRDYIHVVDLALGHVKALQKTLSSTGIAVYNLGTGNGYSVIQVKEALERVSKVKIPYEILNRRPGDVAICYADATKAKNELGWEAKKGLEQMCQDAWKWQENNPNGYH